MQLRNSGQLHYVATCIIHGLLVAKIWPSKSTLDLMGRVWYSPLIGPYLVVVLPGPVTITAGCCFTLSFDLLRLQHILRLLLLNNFGQTPPNLGATGGCLFIITHNESLHLTITPVVASLLWTGVAGQSFSVFFLGFTVLKYLLKCAHVAAVAQISLLLYPLIIFELILSS